MRVAVIGFGAIGSFVIEHLQADRSIEVSAAFSLPRPEACSVPVVDSLEALLATGPELVVECAGHGSLRDVGEAILRHGTDLLVASVGALADSVLEHALRKAAADGGGRLLIPGGALGGIDAVSAAREAGLDSVEYSGRKAPQAWKGTRAEQLIDLISVRQATAFFESDARTAALQFPQNANVVAALALAGLGFEKTKVRLIVDPAADGNNHSFVARGAFGEISASIRSATLPSNPKTSVLAPYSLIQTIKKRAGLILA
ncbi:MULTISPECIES: aspartate dehydrogenase [Bradyrhizobium]|uniref:aspartate dehydrogenase n=1 Tax=Bradyrhizobium TaxID=374 RepID=UPI0002F97AAD|nr:MULTISPECIES: aspartate dehydrogenase [Bradyrhizobium]MCA1396237.1 aspartate dehydrogenase [Bradyrhizobium sp. BRP56]MCW2192047.1 aspartate dehydrogenase [Bradyrhizobium elkanii]